jgi:hypothetical protein
MIQRELFIVTPPPAPIPPQPTVPYVRGSETSRAAAASIASVARATRDKVLAYIAARRARGATDQEIAAGLAMLSDSARARRCELRDRGDIVDSGQRRPSPSGRPSTVWVVPAHFPGNDADRSVGPPGRPQPNGVPRLSFANKI